MKHRSQAPPFVVHVGDLLRRPGPSRQVRIEAEVGEMAVLGSRVEPDSSVVAEVRLDPLNQGVAATGTISAKWRGECRRCLVTIEADLEAPVMEVFEANPIEGETSPIQGDQIDLEPIVREAVLLGLPLAPLCREDCAGLCPMCGADRNQVACDCAPEPLHDRWAALDQLRFEK